jgi:dTDP-4-dehydrorhamnose 3,5-epimerase
MSAARFSIIETPLPGVRLIESARYDDHRGWFAELWNAAEYRNSGFDFDLVQDNVSFSRRGVLRGMHFQWPNPQGKLVTVLSGSVFDVVVDVRIGSPTFGRWFGCELTGTALRQLWVPPGFAHGFLVGSETALVHYGCTAVYDRTSDRAFAWHDAAVGIAWPERPLDVSPKDGAAPLLAAIPPHQLPHLDDLVPGR